MDFYERLTSERRFFLERMNTLIYNEFEKQKREVDDERTREEKIENNIKTISIDGSWGEGKTFFSRALIEK